MKPKGLILLGGGGHCISCIDVIEQEGKHEIIGILDKKSLVGSSILGYKIIGTDENIETYISEGCQVLISVGQIKTPEIRQNLFHKLENLGANFATIISPRSYVSPYAQIGKGSIVMHDALVNANAVIGENCIINTKALIEHDVTIESHCHISTAAVLNGGAHVKEGTFFGSNATSREYVQTNQKDFIKASSLFLG